MVTVGAATAAALLFHRLFDPVGTVLHSFDEVQSAGAGLARLVGVVGIPDEVPAVLEASRRPADSSLELTDIEFGYEPGAPVLHSVSVRIEAGERVALVGSTGAGKTTLAAIAAGLLVPSGGSVRLGGVPVRELTADQVRSQVSIVSQEVHVFAGPLVDDVRLARPEATAEDVRAALACVDALSWVDALPEGIETRVASDHMMEHAELAAVASDVVFVDATVPEQGFTGTASEQWRAQVAGELDVVRIDCAHSELLDPQAIGRWFPAISQLLAMSSDMEVR